MPDGAKIIAHRGASHDAPENTVAAARLAWEQGADLVEIDLHLTRDHRIVAIHDDTTRRTTGGPGTVSEMTLAEIRQLDAGRWKHPRYTGEKIPTLEEILATVPDHKGLLLEIKSDPAAILPILAQSLSASRVACTLISFHLATLRAAREILPHHPALWIIDHPRKSPPLSDLIRQCRAARLTGLDLHHRWPIDQALVRQIHDQGLHLYTWTVDSPSQARRQITAGVQGLTTNRPGWLREKIESSPSPSNQKNWRAWLGSNQRPSD